MSLTDTPIGFAVTGADGQPLIYVGKQTSIKVVLVNNSGVDIDLKVAGSKAAEDASSFAFYPPQDFFTSTELSNFSLSEKGWKGSADTDAGSFNVVCAQAGKWKEGEPLTFTLTNVTASGQPSTGTAGVQLENMSDVALTAPFALANPPKEGNLSLPDVLQLQLDSQGMVYRSSTSDDPLTNRLFLTIKNAGAAALATADKRVGNPQVFVSFVYGNTSGSLAPDDYDPVKGPPVGSAWKIRVDAHAIQAAWVGDNPQWSENLPHPSWLLKPTKTNYSLLGPAQSDSANITFSFSDIVSLTPVGHTQMLVLFTGFAKDETTAYDDHLFVLDIAKLVPPPTRGLISFAGVEPLITVTKPDQEITIDLSWAMFDVASVQLVTSRPEIAPRKKTYPSPQPLEYGHDSIVLHSLNSSQAIFTTLQAFDGIGGYLNSLQFTTYVQLSYVADPDGKLYPIALVGETFWLWANYDYRGQGNTYFYDDKAGYGETYGRLYDFDAALGNPPAAGWVLPTEQDWKALFAAYSGAVPTYTQLIAGGSSGFDAKLGGWRTIVSGSGKYDYGPGSKRPSGFYWTSTDKGSGPMGVQFSESSQSVELIQVSDRKTALSVRYVRRA
jgi:uncharacterized protein (TIGR02145 family)